MDPKKLIGAVVAVFVLFFIVTSPDKSADIAHTGWQIVINTAHGITNFVDKL